MDGWMDDKRWMIKTKEEGKVIDFFVPICGLFVVFVVYSLCFCIIFALI